MVARVQIPKEAKRGEVIEVRIVIQHAMETGFRRDEVGRLIKRNVINIFSCRYDGAEVFRADLSSGIAANPYLQFYTVAEASGEFEFTWMDDAGTQGSERRSITVAA
jgi:sulfur-oxidizing protein SoxZ